MRRTLVVLAVLVLCGLSVSGSQTSRQPAKALKVFISVDMEGISGIVTPDETNDKGADDYQYFRKIMTLEASAAVEGALAAGAAEIWVRDAHGSARNIIPDLLDRHAKLLRDWSGGPMGMMEGIDDSFDAAIFIGYHAKAGTPDATIEHTSSGTVTDMSINGVSLPEAGYNALMAGLYNVPVVFVSGDRALCDQITEILGEVETVAVKEGIGGAALCLHPEASREKIKAGVQKALRNIESYAPFRMSSPYTLVLTLKDENMVNKGSHFPGVERTGEWELTYTADNLIDVMNAFSYMRR